MSDLDGLKEELRLLRTTIDDGVKTMRKWIIVYVIFWTICWFAFVSFWVWRYTRGG